ncbi:MAG: NgoFVII family restriction endonuclease, partial [Clostridiales bacterium]|nr:NgoFVII family restriction endonuclease [Clostridiales bacterium]
MKLLYSDILPLGAEENQETIVECFNNQLKKSDSIEIAVGYVSRASLNELERLIDENNIKHVCLNIGMYFIEGMPEGSYHTACRLNQKWLSAGIGEIRIVRAFKFHGKLYSFCKDGHAFAAINGSANLGVLKLEANNRRQYEIASLTTDSDECREIFDFISRLKAENCSTNIADITNMPLIHEVNTALNGIELVTEVPPSNVDFYRRCSSNLSFFLQLKVPKESEKHLEDGKHFTLSLM